MTAKELRNNIINFLGDKGLSVPFPTKMEVDADTYGHVCQAVFDNVNSAIRMYWDKKELIGEELKEQEIITISVSIGPNNGIMFKGIELILKDKK